MGLVVIERAGKRYAGTYTVDRGVVTVQYDSSTGGGTKSTQLGTTSVESLAQLLLEELVGEQGEKRP